MSEEMNLKDLKVNHDYYCSDNNYYSNEARQCFDTFSEFHDEFHDADVDMNLVFRWDVKERDSGGLCLKLFMIQQRKGIFTPIFIEAFRERDVKNFIKYITPHMKKLASIWEPLKFVENYND